MKRMLVMLMLSVVMGGFAQTEKLVGTEKMVELKHLQGDRANRAVEFVRSVMLRL